MKHYIFFISLLGCGGNFLFEGTTFFIGGRTTLFSGEIHHLLGLHKERPKETEKERGNWKCQNGV